MKKIHVSGIEYSPDKNPNLNLILRMAKLDKEEYIERL